MTAIVNRYATNWSKLICKYNAPMNLGLCALRQYHDINGMWRDSSKVISRFKKLHFCEDDKNKI